MKKILTLALALCATALFAQAEAPQDWWNLDNGDNSYPGVSANKAHEYLKGKKGQTVVVAVIDSGVDIEHEDLKDIIWTNEDEIPGNGIDDDNNGYVDDVHGWNFIGGKDGRNINGETLEVTRLFKALDKKYKNRNPEGMDKKERAEFERYMDYKKQVEAKREELGGQFGQVEMLKNSMDAVVKKIGKKPADITTEDINGLTDKDMGTQAVKGMYERASASGASFADVYGQIGDYYDYLDQSLNYNYNPESNDRMEIVGDNPGNLDDINYGNNDVEGPDAMHGTHVSGIIAAVRDNDLGVNGVGGPNVRIMSVRAVPNGDERDKDVANAIRYAVDNGASIINMSFGKGYSPYKKAVDAAMKYAEKNDVLLVHAAGNDGKDLTLTNNYPNDTYEGKKKTGKTWIEVGASSSDFGETLAAPFSNYNKKYVDVFAPGHRIYATFPDNEYSAISGTSMAAPMVAGIAALLRSYFPDLKAKQVKEIIEESAIPVNLSVVRPGSEEKVGFAELSKTGGLANAYTAVKLAERTKGKKKRTAERDDSLRMY